MLKTAKWLPLCLLFISTQSYSQESVLAVMSGDKKIHHNFHSILKNKLQKGTTLSKINHSEINKELLDKHNLIISIGYKAAAAVSKHKPKPAIIYTLIPDNGPLQTSISCKNKQCYKVYINQPISRYIALFKALFPKRKNLAFATIHKNTKRAQRLKVLSKENRVTYKEIEIEHNNITRTLLNKLNENDILLALPNADIYNATNAKSIILSSYHKNVPIIAYSKSFAKAGALIGLYSSIENIADKTASLTNKIISSGQQKEKEYYPDEFSIEINPAVARSLNIDIEPENIIKRKIK